MTKHYPLVIETVQELTEVFNDINQESGHTACITSGDSMLPIIDPYRVVTLVDYHSDDAISAGDVVSFNVDGRQIIKKLEAIVPDVNDKNKIGHSYYLIGFNRSVSKDYRYFVPLVDNPKNHFKKVILYPNLRVSDKVIAQITK